MNSILLNAILSMDSYNRGYNAKIDFRQKDSHGNYISNSDLLNAKIGNVSFIADSSSLLDNDGNRKDIPAGFYAIAYQDNTSKEITISYRGTDNPVGLKGNDFINGWVGGAGFITSQDGLAFAFYNDVVKQQNNNTAIDPRKAEVSLTGHSLGGGGASWVGGIK